MFESVGHESGLRELRGPSRLQPRFYRVRDITFMTGISRSKVFQALQLGELKALKLDGILLIPTESFEAWIARAVPYQPSKGTPWRRRGSR